MTSTQRVYERPQRELATFLSRVETRPGARFRASAPSVMEHQRVTTTGWRAIIGSGRVAVPGVVSGGSDRGRGLWLAGVPVAVAD